MAKPLTDILRTPIEFPFQYINPDIRNCPCGCGPLIRNRHRYIESNVTGEWYCDMVCMVKAEGCTWDEDGIRDEFGDWYTEDGYKDVMEVVEHGG